MPLYEKAATIGAAHFPVDFTRWPDSAKELGDSWISVKHGIALFQRKAILHADTGETQAAVVALGKSLRLLSTLENLPTVIAQLAWMDLVSDTLQTLRFMLSLGLQERDQIQQVDGWLADLHKHNAYDVAWAGERCILRGSFDIRDVRPEGEALEMWNAEQEEYADDKFYLEDPSEFSKRPTSPKPNPGNWRLVYELPYKLAGLETLDCVLSMRAVDTAYILSRKNIDVKHAWLKAYQARRQETSRWMLPNSRCFLLDPDQILLSTVVTESTISAARTALSVEQYRMEHGILPTDLSALPDSLESRTMLRYERLKMGYAVNYDGRNADNPIIFEVTR